MLCKQFPDFALNVLFCVVVGLLLAVYRVNVQRFGLTDAHRLNHRLVASDARLVSSPARIANGRRVELAGCEVAAERLLERFSRSGFVSHLPPVGF